MNSNDVPIGTKGRGPNEPSSLSDSLEAEINDLQHELRRVRDGLERMGGSSHELENSAVQLSRNIRQCEKELAEIARVPADNSMQRDSSHRANSPEKETIEREFP